MILGYSEQVVTDASDYTGIEVQDNTVDPATLNAVATGTVIQKFTICHCPMDWL